MNNFTALLALVFAAAMWGSNGVAARFIGPAFPPLFMSWGRWLIALLILIPFVWSERRVIYQTMHRNWKIIFLLSMLCNVPQSALIYKGLEATTVINIGLLNSTIPVLVLIVGQLFFGRSIRTKESIGALISMFGVSYLLFEGSIQRLITLTFNIGDALAFLGMLTWSIYTLLLSRRPSGISLFGFVFCMSLVGVIICAPAVITEAMLVKAPELSYHSVLTLIYIAVGPTLIGTLCFTYGAERLGAAKAGFFVHLMPVFATLLAIALVGERIEQFQVLGFFLIAGGAIFALSAKA